jgi:hypothetical protein
MRHGRVHPGDVIGRQAFCGPQERRQFNGWRMMISQMSVEYREASKVRVPA